MNLFVMLGKGDPMTFLGFPQCLVIICFCYNLKIFILCAFVTVTEAILVSYKAWEEENMFAMYLQNTRWVPLEVAQSIWNQHHVFGSHHFFYSNNQISPSQLCCLCFCWSWLWLLVLGLSSYQLLWLLSIYCFWVWN